MTLAERRAIVAMNEDGPALAGVVDLLEGAGYAVVPCADAATIHEVVRARMPDLVLLDRRDTLLPGGRALAMLRLDAHTSAIPVVQCFSASAEHALAAARAEAMGCSILIAPFEPGALLDRVRDVLATSAEHAGSR